MDNQNFLSSAEHIATPLDCRKLSLSIYFYQLNQEKIICLSNEIMRWIRNLGNTAFVYSWWYGFKKSSEKKIWEQIMHPAESQKGINIAFEACVRSSVIFNQTTMNKFQHEYTYIHPIYSFGWDHDPGLSAMDYLSYYNSLFPNKPSNEEIISKLHTIFQEPNRKCLSLHLPFDFSGSFHADPYKNYSELFYGEVNVSFSAFCIGNSIDRYAEIFSDFVKYIAEKYIQINAHVRLQPPTTARNQYMRYFGQYIVSDGSHINARCTQKEWYPTYYLCGVEWLNILSPLARQHHNPKDELPFNEAEVVIQEIPGGCLLVRSPRPITKYGWVDAIALKHYLINTLCPGGKQFPLRLIFQEPQKGITDFCPRNDWAIVPVEDGEIRILGSELSFTSISSQL